MLEKYAKEDFSHLRSLRVCNRWMMSRDVVELAVGLALTRAELVSRSVQHAGGR